eukprot:Em0007g1374a
MSLSGNRYTLTLRDHFSKWVEAVAVPKRGTISGNKEPNTANHMEQVSKQRQRILKNVKYNILVAQAKQKQQYDAKYTRASLFEIGVKVVKQDFLQKKRKGGKSDAKWNTSHHVAIHLIISTSPYNITLFRLHLVNKNGQVYLKLTVDIMESATFSTSYVSVENWSLHFAV